MTSLPSSDLELKAADERRRLHSSVLELKSRVRDSLDFGKKIRDNLGLACSVVALVGLVAGYTMAGVFVASNRR